MSFTLLHDEDGPLGALLLPSGTRTEPFTLEEARALRGLADRLAAVLSSSAALARARARELVARQIAERLGDRIHGLERLNASEGERHESLARRTSRSVLVARYSPSARAVLEELERVAKVAAPLALLSPPGVDPTPYAAFVHGAGPRPAGPFVVVDATGAEEQRESYWRDPRCSPLRLANGGSLVLLSVAGLAPAVQIFLVEALSRRSSAPEGDAAPLEVSLIVSVPTTIDALAATGRLEPDLADLLGDRAIPLPSLLARADDLRTLFMERLARIGVRLKGRPMGLDARALTRLVEHAWPGNEIELDDVLTRAVTVADGEIVTTAHLDQIGFVALAPLVRRSLRPPAAGQQPLGS
jgi:DNA-binding NtrC family response regulator